MAQASRKPAASSSLQKLRDRIKDIELEVVEKEVTLLAYGDKGTGKTTALQGLAQKLKGEGRILRLDSSDGWISLENIPQLKADTDNLEYVTLVDLGLIVVSHGLAPGAGEELHKPLQKDQVRRGRLELKGIETRGLSRLERQIAAAHRPNRNIHAAVLVECDNRRSELLHLSEGESHRDCLAGARLADEHGVAQDPLIR